MLGFDNGLGLGYRNSDNVPPITTPLRVIGVNQRLANNKTTVSGGRQSGFSYIPALIGQDARTLVLSFWWYNVGGNELSVGNIGQIDECAVIAPNGAVVPVTFPVGSPLQLSSYTSDLNSNPIFAQDFGLDYIGKGEYYWIKTKFSFPANGAYPYDVGLRNSYPGVQYGHYDSALTTLSSTNESGPFTATGSSPQYAAFGYHPVVLGNPVVDAPSFFLSGTSIAEGAGDGPNGIYGGGFLSRAVGDANGIYPSINCARSSSQSTLLTGGHNAKRYIKYCKCAIDEYMTNDINGGGVTLATAQSRANGLWSLYRSSGVEKIIRTELLFSGSSTDNFLTYAGQTVSSAWTPPSGVAVQFNDWLATKLADGTIDALVSMANMRDPAGTYKALVDGITPFLVTGDGLHPSQNGHTLAGLNVRGAIQAMFP